MAAAMAAGLAGCGGTGQETPAASQAGAEGGGDPVDSGEISQPPFLLNTRFKAKQHRLFDWFGPLTFGVYLIHPIFIDIAKEFIRFPWASALYIPLLLIVILIVSSLIVWVLSKLPGLKKIVS